MRRPVEDLVKTLFEEHRGALLRFLIERLGSPEDADDVAQEAYLRLLGVERLEKIRNLRAYLFATAANLLVDRTRVAARNRPREAEFRQQAKQAAAASGSVGSPEDEILLGERLKELEAALDELPSDCRRAFLLHRVGGRSYAQIAQELGVSPSMVEKHMIRALDHFRRVLR